MRQYQPQWSLLISGLVVTTTILLLIVALVTGIVERKDSWTILGWTGTLSTCVAIAWGLFRKKLWKWKHIHGRWIDCPDIGGRWAGVIRSNFGGDKPLEIPIEVQVNQTLTSVNVAVRATQSSSHSVSANLVCDDEAQRGRLIYTYFNEPKSLEKLDKHWGTAILEFDSCCRPEMMEGSYMTDRTPQTKGEMVLKRA